MPLTNAGISALFRNLKMEIFNSILTETTDVMNMSGAGKKTSQKPDGFLTQSDILSNLVELFEFLFLYRISRTEKR